jgi:hypothetical protein
VKANLLKVTYGESVATFDLGDQAAVWADKIRNPKSRIDKLGIKQEHRVGTFNLRDKEFARELKARAASVSSSKPMKDADALFLGAERLEDLSIADYIPFIKRDGAIWTITPKGKNGIKDTDIMAVGKAAGLVAVKVVAFSDTHSANKFVIPKSKR